MSIVESIINDIQTLGTVGQEEILNYLEEVIMLLQSILQIICIGLSGCNSLIQKKTCKM